MEEVEGGLLEEGGGGGGGASLLDAAMTGDEARVQVGGWVGRQAGGAHAARVMLELRVCVFVLPSC